MQHTTDAGNISVRTDLTDDPAVQWNGFRFAAQKCKVVHFTAPRNKAQ